MINLPTIGQTVKLNSEGMSAIGGLHSEEQINQAKKMTITYVSNNPLTNDGSELYDIEVNQPLINKFMLNNYWVDTYK